MDQFYSDSNQFFLKSLSTSLAKLSQLAFFSKFEIFFFLKKLEKICYRPKLKFLEKSIFKIFYWLKIRFLAKSLSGILETWEFFGLKCGRIIFFCLFSDSAHKIGPEY